MTRYQLIREALEEMKDAEDCLFAAANCLSKASSEVWSKWVGDGAEGIRKARKYLERWLRETS
jgi:hypothetical protein